MQSNDNTMFCGSTGYGKSTAACHSVMYNGGLVVVLDQQPDATAGKLWAAACDLQAAVIYDDLDDEDRHFPLNLLDTRSENDIEDFRELAVRRRGEKNTDAMPLIEMWIDLWCRVLPPHWTIKQGLQIFRGGDAMRTAIDMCIDDDVRDAWLDLPAGGAARERIIGAAERALTILGRDSIACRTYRGTNEFIQMIDNGYSFLSGGGKVISNAMLRLISSARMKQIIKYKTKGGRQDVNLLIEESEAGAMLGQQEGVAIQTLRKTGLKWTIVCQEPFWVDEPTTEIVMQNTNHVWMRCDSERVALMGAKDLCGVLFNPYAVKETYESSFKLGENTFLERRPNYYSEHEQVSMLKKAIMCLPRAAGFAKVGNEVRYVQFPEFKPRTSAAEAEQKRKEQIWLRETSHGGFSTTSTHTPQNKQSQQDSFRATRSPIEDLFD